MTADILRTACFFGIFAALAYAENRWPRTEMTVKKNVRWTINIALAVLNSLAVKFLFGAAAVGTAWHAKANGWGFLNWAEAGPATAFIFTFVFMDFMIYLQHVFTHALPILWRLHIIHHTDMNLDLSTSIRFHPIEIIFSMVLKIGLVAAIGADPWAMVFFEIILNGSAQFHHSNLKLPPEWDKRLRRLVVTPDMHEIHHSIEVGETNSNFGFFLSVWDRMCGTYKESAALPNGVIVIGITEYREPEKLTFRNLLKIPFSPKLGKYSMKS